MKTIHKYTLGVTDTQVILMPINAEIVSIQNQNDTITLWAIVDTNTNIEQVTFSIYGTGHPITGMDERYIGTVQMDNGLVWHVLKANM